METADEILEYIQNKITETQEETEQAEIANESDEHLSYLAGLLEAYEHLEAAINYQRADA